MNCREENRAIARAKFRRVFCSHYNECLDRAIRTDSPSFRCDTCGSFQEEENEAEYRLEQALRAAELVMEVFGLPSGPDGDRIVLRGPGTPLGGRVRKKPERS